MDTRTFLRSRSFKIFLIVLSFVVTVLVSFAGGMAVGLRKAHFSYDWGERYERQFMGSGWERPMPMMGRGLSGWDRNGRSFRNGHGVTGDVLSTADGGHTLVVKNPDNNENTIQLRDDTVVRRGNDTLQPSDIQIGDTIVVFGKPGDSGAVQADFIRVFRHNTENGL